MQASVNSDITCITTSPNDMDSPAIKSGPDKGQTDTSALVYKNLLGWP